MPSTCHATAWRSDLTSPVQVSNRWYHRSKESTVNRTFVLHFKMCPTHHWSAQVWHILPGSHKRTRQPLFTESTILPLLPGHRCLQHKAPQYTTDCCIHASDIARRQHQRSTGCHQLFVPRHRHLKFRRPAFSVASPAAWNSLPARSVTFRWQFSPGPENFSFLVLIAYTVH